MKNLCVFATAALIIVLNATGSNASTIIWNLDPNPNTSPGPSASFTVNNIAIIAAGFTSTSFGAAVGLYEKGAGGDEIGLGLTNDPTGDHEISGTSLIRIDFTSARNAGITGFGFQMGSSTGGEQWQVLGSNSATSGYSLVAGGADENAHVLSGVNDSYRFYIFQAVPTMSYNQFGFPTLSGNVLLGNISGDPVDPTPAVPEPATWAMMLLGFAGLGFAFRQSRRKVSFG
jgi:hypothetical protein